MKATGIVRRIDDLGRVVIPKEIRRTLRIKEGEPLEIFTDGNGGVVFKKYSPLGELGTMAGTFAEVLNRQCKTPVIICDNDACIAACGIGKKEVLGRPVSEELAGVYNSRKNYFLSEMEPLCPLQDMPFQALAACPIITSGDVLGSVILLYNKEHVIDTDLVQKIASASAALFASWLQE